MNAIPIDYLLRLSIIWGALLVYYHFFLAKNHNWQLRRVYLFSTYLLGILIPLLPAVQLNPLPEVLPDLSVIPNFAFETAAVQLEAVESRAFSWWLVIPLLYGIGVFVQLCLFLKNSWQIWRWKQVGERSSFGRYAIVEHHSIPSPFAGWRTIFLPRKLDEELQSVACLHEAAHLRSHHNLERLPLALGQILFWFHPLQWYYNHALSTVQEYQADEAVLQHIPTKTYGHILIQQSMQPTHQWQAGLFASPLKQRINMMVSQKNKQPWRLPQMSLFLGLLGLLVFSCSDMMSPAGLDYENVISHLEADQAPVLVTRSEETPSKHFVNPTLLKTIYSTIKYPATARRDGIEGSILANFIVDEQGKLNALAFATPDGYFKADPSGKIKAVDVKPANFISSDDEVVIVGYGNTEGKTSASPSGNLEILIEEITRVMTTLPDWKPAMKDGKAVPVSMDLSFRYKLE